MPGKDMKVDIRPYFVAMFAYREGRLARRVGRLRNDNPYHQSYQHLSWAAAWYMGWDEENEGIPTPKLKRYLGGVIAYAR